MSSATPAPAAPAIDRVAPTLRPPGWPLMRQRWAHLLFLHWSVPPEALRPLLPPGLDLDTFEGRAYVGLIPFTMTGVRPIFTPPIPGLSNFHETNLRTYVHRAGSDPGVWFFSLDAANPVAVRAARWFLGLPYCDARMRMRFEDDRTIDYATERTWPGPLPAECRVKYRFEGTPEPARLGTLEYFLAERYILYARKGDRLLLGRVHHVPYPLQPASVLNLEETILAAHGIARPDVPPLAHYASEVRVWIYPIRPVSE